MQEGYPRRRFRNCDVRRRDPEDSRRNRFEKKRAMDREPGELSGYDEPEPEREITIKQTDSPASRSLSSSRWAESDEDKQVVAPKRKRIGVPTPEPGEVTRGGSVRAVSRSSGSDRGEIGRERRIYMLQGCRSVDEFERLNKVNEGTYGVVYRARDKKTGEVVALKRIKMEREKEGFPMTSFREINILFSLQHPSIVDVKEVVVGSSMESVFMVMEYMEHDLKGVMETMKQPYCHSEVKCLMIQLLEGVNYLHQNWVLHRYELSNFGTDTDLKTVNLLINNGGELKICDFGLARQYGSPLKPYTPTVVTLWYRAPELLLEAKEYSTAVDMWSVGCIMAELLEKKPLFKGQTEKEQLYQILQMLGMPDEALWPGYKNLAGVNRLRERFPRRSFVGQATLSLTDAGFDLLSNLLRYDPNKRITAEDALRHPWFRETPLPKSKLCSPQ